MLIVALVVVLKLVENSTQSSLTTLETLEHVQGTDGKNARFGGEISTRTEQQTVGTEVIDSQQE